MRTSRFLLVAALAIVVLAGCSASPTDELIERINTSSGSDVSLAGLATHTWTNFLVVCPYESDVELRLGFEWPEAPDTYASDNSALIVFVEDSKVVDTTSVTLTQVDLCTRQWQLTPASSVVNFRKSSDGGWTLTN